MKLVANVLFFGLIIGVGFATAGPIDPDCTAAKAAKSAAMKATVGLGGRCSPQEAVADTAKRRTGIDQDRKDRDDNGLLGREKDGK